MLRRRRRSAVLAMMAVTVLLVGVDFARGGSASVDPTADLHPEDGTELVLPPSPQPSRKAPSGPPDPAAKIPKRGAGTFAIASGGSPRVGNGKLLTYRVESENGSGEDAKAFAAQVDSTLADRRSWTADGQWAFRRVSKGEVDFVVRLATADTVDRICAAAGLQTGGSVSCRTGPFVMINLVRWKLAVPEYKGDVALYRHYVINHEVGHRLGHGHELCPGAGKTAPIMQQQTYGLSGCVPNGWPFVNGRYVRGPATTAN
jgi:hypothetical protein